jgi:hypothetical protein
MAVILLEAAAGGAVVLWASRVHGHVRRGFFLLAGITLALCAVGAWAVTRSAVGVASTAAQERMLVALAVFAALMVAWQVLLVAGDNALSRGAGLLAAAAGLPALGLFGAARGDDPVWAVAELALGAVFLGSALHGLLLGHWYMVERRLAKDHMVTSAWWYGAGVAAAAAAVALSARNPAPSITAVASPLLSVPGFSVLLGAGLVAICALIAGFVFKLAHEGGRSIQAATGMFYLAVIMAFSAELAAKFRFF